MGDLAGLAQLVPLGSGGAAVAALWVLSKWRTSERQALAHDGTQARRDLIEDLDRTRRQRDDAENNVRKAERRADKAELHAERLQTQVDALTTQIGDLQREVARMRSDVQGPADGGSP